MKGSVVVAKISSAAPFPGTAPPAPPPAPLPEAAQRMALLLAVEPVAELRCELPQPPGINDWWEPVTIRRKGHSVASMRLSRAATRYKAHAEDVLVRAGVDLVALEDEFRDLWLQLHVVSYIATPLERDSDGPLNARVSVRIEGYQVWDAGGMGGPFYMVRSRDTPAGRRTEPLPLTPRRLPAWRVPLAAR